MTPRSGKTGIAWAASILVLAGTAWPGMAGAASTGQTALFTSGVLQVGVPDPSLLESLWMGTWGAGSLGQASFATATANVSGGSGTQGGSAAAGSSTKPASTQVVASSTPSSVTTTDIGGSPVTSGRFSGGSAGLFSSLAGWAMPSLASTPVASTPSNPPAAGGTGTGGATSTTVAPPTDNSVAAVLSWVNAQRAAVGVGPLQLDPALSTLAEERAERLSSMNLITHDVPGYGLPAAMETAAGISGTLIGGEDLSTGHDAYQAFWMLMDSDWHRANLLFSSWNTIGIGMAPIPAAPGMITLDLMFLER